MTMNMNEIERALRELRLSGVRATLDTRILQAQASEQPFLETFSLILQDELDRRRSRLTERRYQHSGLDERMRSGNTYGVTDGNAVNGSGAGGIRLGGWQFAWWLPVMRQQGREVFVQQRWQALKHVLEIGPRVMPVELG